MNSCAFVPSFLIGVLTGILGNLSYQFFINVGINRRNIYYNLEIILDLIRQFENSIEFNNYELAMTQIDRIIDKLGIVYENVQSYTFFFSKKNKKLFLTLLYNLQYFCQIMKNLGVGADNLEDERIAVCKNIRSKYLFKINNSNQSHILFSMKLAQRINIGTSLKEFLQRENCTPENAKMIVYRNIFGYPKLSKYEMPYGIFTKNEFEKYITQLCTETPK